MDQLSFGDTGEKIAAKFLHSSGYAILERNYRTKTGEIDIIAKKNGVICFVEVKTRSSYVYGTPAQAVTYRKQQKIINTALCFLRQYNISDVPFRFDVLEVLLSTGSGKAECNYIINAFGR